MLPSVQGDDESGLRHLSHLSHTTNTVERRLLQLIKQRAGGAVSLEDFIGELSGLRGDLGLCYRQIAETSGRRDLSFSVIVALDELDQCCQWLYRKTHLEQAFFEKLHLEQRLRTLISPEADEVYQELLNIEEREREFVGKEASDIKRLMLTENGSSPPVLED
ncbi:MAG: hypothetical protein E6H00_01195 [Bacillati bacterium ANGP1]|uniref:Uncharacterized protein n=1 Tax=Candidatus Segetimicrobium genomatis TaxID=2569760 RepID=A0A537KCI6_9BACT|nr:MAG: hypothetical protein E6H00_01195 [Terrabacteria group bacterium ANGP1]